MPGQRLSQPTATVCVKGVCVFMCKLPPAVFAEWPGPFTCHCGNTGVERTQNKSQHTKLTLEKKILPPSAGIRTRAPLPGISRTWCTNSLACRNSSLVRAPDLWWNSSQWIRTLCSRNIGERGGVGECKRLGKESPKSLNEQEEERKKKKEEEKNTTFHSTQKESIVCITHRIYPAVLTAEKKNYRENVSIKDHIKWFFFFLIQ